MKNETVITKDLANKKLHIIRYFAATACFCDEDGNINSDFPKMYWNNVFEATEAGTKLEVDLSFDSGADLEKIVAMGFEGGFTMGLNNLAELLAAE